MSGRSKLSSIWNRELVENYRAVEKITRKPEIRSRKKQRFIICREFCMSSLGISLKLVEKCQEYWTETMPQKKATAKFSIVAVVEARVTAF